MRTVVTYLDENKNRTSKEKAWTIMTQIFNDADHRIAVEYEAPEESGSTDDIKHRRSAFYHRSGFEKTGLYTFYDDTEFEIACAGQSFDEEEFSCFIDHLSTIIEDHIPHPYRKDSL